MDGLGGVVVASVVSSVVNVLLWLALAIVIGVTVRGTGRVLGILACVVPLASIGFAMAFSFGAQVLYEAVGVGAVVLFQVVNAILTLVGVALLCAAVITASRPRPATGGLR